MILKNNATSITLPEPIEPDTLTMEVAGGSGDPEKDPNAFCIVVCRISFLDMLQLRVKSAKSSLRIQDGVLQGVPQYWAVKPNGPATVIEIFPAADRNRTAYLRACPAMKEW